MTYKHSNHQRLRLAALTALLGFVLPASAATLTRTSAFAYDPATVS